MKAMWMLLLFALPLVGLVYVGWHVWTLLPLGAWWKSVLLAFGVGCCLLLVLDFTGRLDALPMPLARAAYVVGTSSLIVLLYMVMVFLVLDLGHLLRIVPSWWLRDNWYVAGTVSFGMVAVFAYGYANYRHKVRVEVNLRAERALPREYKIVMASDLHLGYHNTRRELARWVDMINREKPDFILIAGDIIDMSVRPLVEEGMAEEFRRLEAPVYACPGNHEYYSGIPEAWTFYREAGIHLLDDRVADIDGVVAVVGRDDRAFLRRRPLKELVDKAGRGKYIIVLDHQPYDLDRAEACGVDFQMSGHTHRGQVWPLSWITDRMYECSWGEYRRGRTRFYVSSGLGIWGGMFRIGTQSEYVVATLK